LSDPYSAIRIAFLVLGPSPRTRFIHKRTSSPTELLRYHERLQRGHDHR
jgi:hypothetical protein